MNQFAPICPCCRRPPPPDYLVWTPEARTLVGRNVSAQFGPIRSKVFDVLWRARKTGEPITIVGMMARIWENEINGGPLSTNNVSVHIDSLRDELKQFGLSIENTGGRGGGYRLIETPLPMDEVEAVARILCSSLGLDPNKSDGSSGDLFDRNSTDDQLWHHRVDEASAIVAFYASNRGK